MRSIARIGIAGALIGVILCSVRPLATAQEEHEIKIDSKRAGNADNIYFDAVKATMQGDDKQAMALFTQFIKEKPGVAAAHYELSRLYMRANNLTQATEHIRKAISLDKENKWFQLQYANVLVMRNEHTQAADIYRAVARTSGYGLDYQLKAALLYQRAGKYKEALELLDKQIAQTGADEDILMQKQQIYLKMNDVDNAVKMVQQLIAQSPKEARYYAMMAQIYESNKQPEKAKEAYENAQRLFPDDASVQLALAMHYKQSGDTARYKDYVSRTITNKDLDAETQLGLLLPYLQELRSDADRKKESLALIEKIVVQHENDANVLAAYADVLSMNEEHGKAMAQYKKAIAADPSKFAIWQQLLFNYTDREDADSLIVYSEKAMRLFPNQAIVHYLNAIGYLNRKDFHTAIKSVNRAIDLQVDEHAPMLIDMYATLGDLYNYVKQYELSDSALSKALSLDPDNASVLNNYAYYLSERGVRLDDAERMSKRSLQMRPDEATFMDTYGWVLYKTGKYKEAREYIQKAIEADSAKADGTLFEHLGDIYFRLNDTDKAVEYWRKSKEKGNDDPAIDKKIQDRKI